ncbi:hypothetical protein PENTCL1PPCAC_20263, partial [Pristionchus entomophagus]
FCFLLGVNFYRNRGRRWRALSMVIVAVNCCISFYFVGFVAVLCLRATFDAERIATSIMLCTWELQASLSTLFLAYWQSSGAPCKILRALYEANKGSLLLLSNHQLSSLFSDVYQ